jgi:hypothetical protein
VTGDVAAPIEIAGDAALEASLSRAGIGAFRAATSITAAAARTVAPVVATASTTG